MSSILSLEYTAFPYSFYGFVICFIDKIRHIYYNIIIAGFFRKEGGENMGEYILSIILSVAACIIGYFVCKWLDRHNTGK